MSFKFHLLIVAAIIFLLILAGKLINSGPKDVAVPASGSSAYTISIVRASWGLECNDSLNSSTPIVSENNVRDKIVSLCEGKSECTVPVDISALGPDPAPKCPNKQLSIEYRCFTYDRLQSVKASSGPLSVKCDQTIQPQPKP